MPLTDHDITRIADQVARAIIGHLPGDPAAAGRRWVNIDQAATWSGYGIKKLKALAKNPATCVIGYPDPDDGRHKWIFDLASIHQYRLTPQTKTQTLEKTIAKNLKTLLP